MLRKSIAIFVVASAAVFALHRLVVVPWRCNLVEGRVSRSTDVLWESRNDFGTRDAAERNLREVASCIEARPTDVNLRMLAASNLTILGRHEAAAAMLEEALRHERRPELRFALGLAQIRLGRREEALRNFVIAAGYGGLRVLRDVPDGELRAKAYALAGARVERAAILTGELDRRNRAINGAFAANARAAGTTTPDAENASPSAAPGWYLFSPTGAAVSSSLEPSTRRAGGTSLHVTAAAAESGLRQIVNEPPKRALISAWVFVRRGQVYLGSGSARTPVGAVSNTTGRWERLETLNDTCPARLIVINAATVGGADYYVDEVTAVATLAAPPCE